jgi:hypothetical protein
VNLEIRARFLARFALIGVAGEVLSLPSRSGWAKLLPPKDLEASEETEMSQHPNNNRRLGIEPLERRDLLCGGAATGIAGFQSASQSALFARAPAASGLAAASRSTDSGSEDESSQTHLFATLTDSSGTVLGAAAYESDVSDSPTTQVLVIRVIGSAANATYEITADTTDLGALTTDAHGNGQLILRSTNPSSSSATAATSGKTVGRLPADFTLAAGATIMLASTDASVDALNGTFATSSGDIGLGHGHGCHGGDHEGDDEGDHEGEHGNVARLVAQLTDTSSTSAGKAVFTTITHADGTTDQILRVHVKGADANAPLEVSIDGTSVGSIMTDDNGNGQLILATNPHNSNVGQLPSGLNVTSTSTITVGTSITGTFSSTGGSSSSAISSFANRFTFHRR